MQNSVIQYDSTFDAILVPVRVPLRQPAPRSSGFDAWHGLSLLSVVLAVAPAWLLGSFEWPLLRDGLMALRQQVGLFVLMALALPALDRLKRRMPDNTPPMPGALKTAVKFSQLAMCALLLALPLLVWATGNALTEPPIFLDRFPPPDWLTSDAHLVTLLLQCHKITVWSLLILVVFHTVVAIGHRTMRRDAAWLAMLAAQHPSAAK